MKISNTIILYCALINYSALNTMEIVTLDPQSPNNIQGIWSQLPATTQKEIIQFSKSSRLSWLSDNNFRFINEEELEKIKNYPQEIKNYYFTDKAFFLTDETNIKKSTKDCLGMTSAIVLPLSAAWGLFLTYAISTIPDNPFNHDNDNSQANFKIGLIAGTTLSWFVGGAVLSAIFAIRRGLQKFY